MASDKDRPGPSRQSGSGKRKRPVEPRPVDLEAAKAPDQAPPEGDPSDVPQSQAAEPPREETPPEAPAPPTPEDEAAVAEQAGEGAANDGVDQAPGSVDEPSGEDQSASAAVREGEGDGPPPAQRQSRFAAALFAAGVGGGLVALLLMFGLGVAGIWPPAEDPALRAELTQSQARIDALEEAGVPPAVDPDDIEQLAGRVAALEEAEIEVPPAADPEAVEGLAERLAALEAQFEEADLAAFEERLAVLETEAEDVVASEEMDEALAEIGARVDELAGALSGLAEGIGPDPQIAERLSQLESLVGEERGAREALVSRVDNLETRLDEAAAAGGRQLARAAAGAAALGGLARAVEAGRPYAGELAALQPLMDDPQAIETLAAHAETGLPTRAELSERFGERVTAILGARDDPDEPPGLLNRLTETVGGLVRVRPVEPMEGDTRTAIVSRIEAALAAGNLDAAYEEWQDLDQPARQASAQWAATLEERRAADGELERLFAELTAILGQRAEGAD